MRKGITLGWLVAAVMTLGWPASSLANTITVNSLNDVGATGICTLRDAITAANTSAAVNGCGAGSGTDTINFSLSGTISVATTLPTIANTLTIDGTGQSIDIDGGGGNDLIEVASTATVSISKLTISGSSVNGPGIFNDGTLSVTACTLSGNIGNDGAINNQPDANLTVVNSTFSGNDTAIVNNASAAVTNSTFSGNTAGVFAEPHSTISLRSTILAASPCVTDTGSIVDDGFNISDDHTCGFTMASSKSNTDPKLSPAGLANNGGPTQTIALLAGSPAIDAIPHADCVDQASPTPNQITSDQRGFPRPDPEDGPNGPCDIGAYEFQDPQGIVGVVKNVPAASLLLPYFEVDLNNSTPAADTTVLSITNTSATAILNHVVIWTDLGVPALEFNVYLTGYDLFRLNLQQLLLTGNMPQTASAGQDPGDLISPKGTFSQDINFASCNGQLPYSPLPGPQLAGIQAALTGHASVNYGTNLCGAINHGDNIARGYITIDTVNNCTIRFPGEAGYFGAGGSGDVTNQNVLVGDAFYLNPAKNHAFSVPLVSLTADATNPATNMTGDYTFYGKYDNFTAIDNRQPTSTNFINRYVNAGSPQGLNYINQGSQVIVWRDSKISGVTSPLGFTCGTPPSWYPLGQEGLVAFDEQENIQAPAVTNPFPAQTRKVPLAGATVPITFPEGLLYLDLNTSVSGQSANLSDQAAAQAWVLAIYDQGVGSGGNNPTNSWEMGEEATLLDSAENANHTIPAPIIPAQDQ
jgi:hypothetical protein